MDSIRIALASADKLRKTETRFYPDSILLTLYFIFIFLAIKTRSHVFSETSPKVACTITHNANSVIFSEVSKTTRVAHMACVNVSQETRRASMLAHRQNGDEDQSCHLSLLWTPQFQVARGS